MFIYYTLCAVFTCTFYPQRLKLSEPERLDESRLVSLFVFLKAAVEALWDSTATLGTVGRAVCVLIHFFATPQCVIDGV